MSFRKTLRSATKAFNTATQKVLNKVPVADYPMTTGLAVAAGLCLVGGIAVAPPLIAASMVATFEYRKKH